VDVRGDFWGGCWCTGPAAKDKSHSDASMSTEVVFVPVTAPAGLEAAALTPPVSQPMLETVVLPHAVAAAAAGGEWVLQSEASIFGFE